MNYAKITYPDLNNGIGCRVTLWLCGCTHHCIGCHNKELQNFNYGNLFWQKTYIKLVKILQKPYIKGLTISGGDPMDNEDILPLLRKIKSDFINKDIWVYTGYTLEELKEFNDYRTQSLKYIDVLVDGKYIEKERDVTLAFRGSTNQRIITNKEFQ